MSESFSEEKYEDFVAASSVQQQTFVSSKKEEKLMISNTYKSNGAITLSCSKSSATSLAYH